MSQSRQLAAIMFTDIVGYTALMQQDEKRAFSILKRNLSIHQEVINEFRGKLIKELGDGILASFSNVSDALNAAIKIQNQCTQINEFKLSIGIHQGEVVFENGDVLGDAVNVASRIQSLGIAGSILFSKKITDEIKNKAQFQAISLGSFEFKNVHEPIEVFALSNDGFPVPQKNRMQGKLKKTSMKRNLIATGSVIIVTIFILLITVYFFSKSEPRKGNRRITANQTAYEWYTKAEYRITYENKSDLDSAIFFLIKSIEADSTFALAHAELSRAYSFKHYFIDPMGGYNEKAFVEAEKSLYLNPDLAEGYFAEAYSLWNFQNKFPHEKTIRECKKAIELKPDMDIAYHHLGVVYMHVGLIDESIDIIKKATQLNPNNKNASLDLTSTYLFTGKKADMEKMIDLFKATPDKLMSPFRTSQWGIALIALDRLEEAASILDEGLNKDSTNLFINSAYSILLAVKGNKIESFKKIEFCERSNLNTGHFHHAVYSLAVAYSILGENEKAVAKLNWVADNGLPNYTYFREDPLLAALRQNSQYIKLMEKLKVSWTYYKKIASE